MDENVGGTPNPLNPNPVAPGVGVAGTGENMPAAENYNYMEQPVPEQYADPAATPAMEPMAPAEPAMPAGQPTMAQPMPAGVPRPPMHGQAMDFIQRPMTAQMSPEMAQAQIQMNAQMAQMNPQLGQMAQPMMQPEMPAQMPVQPQMEAAGFDSFAMETQPAATDPMVAQMANVQMPAEPQLMGQMAQPMNARASGMQPTMEEELAFAMEDVAGVPAPGQVTQPAEPAQKSAKSAKGKKKTGMIVAIVLFGVAIICGLAAVLVWLLNPGGSDKVAAAIDKLLSGNAPAYVQAEGTLSVLNNEGTYSTELSTFSTWSSLSMQLKGVQDTRTTAAGMSGTVTMWLENGSDIEFDVEGVRSSDGDVYVRLDGIATAATDMVNGLVGEATNCVTDADGNTNCAAPVTSATDCGDDTDCLAQVYAMQAVESTLAMYEALDGEWIRIPATQDEDSFTDTSSLCTVNAILSLSEYYSDLKPLYSQNSFITASTDNLKIASKGNTLYRLNFDQPKVTAFANSLAGSSFAQSLADCAGTAAGQSSLSAQVKSMFSSDTTAYAEVDNNNDFTRLYLSGEMDDAAQEVKADFNLSYPASITINEPDEYVDIEELLMTILVQFYGSITGEE